MGTIKSIGILTSGGDAPGMNAAIRAVTRSAIYNGLKVYGIYRGYKGLVTDEIQEFKSQNVSNIIQMGGTILKTARCKEFTTPEGRAQAYENMKKHEIDALVIIGGDGSLTGARIFAQEFDVPCIGLPGTIDNDLYGTDTTIGYDTASLSNEDARTTYKGEVTTDYYGRKVPKHAHGTANLESPTSSARLISEAVMELFDRIVNPNLLVRRINLTTNHVVDEDTAAKNQSPVQYDLFTDYEALERKQREEKERLAKERKIQTAILNIKKQFGKNAILKGLNYEEGATAKERNEQIGGHKA